MSALKIGELAKKSGLSVRALRHYNDIGLLVPSSRTTAEHRLYSSSDILKLEKILSLQQIGLTLTEIKDCLEAQVLSFHDIAMKHMMHLLDQIQASKKLYDKLDRITRLFSDQDQIPVEEVLKIIEVLAMYEKYYTPEQLEMLKSRQINFSSEQQKDIENRWQKVFEGIKKAYQSKTAVSDPSVIALGIEANALISEFTGNDPKMQASLENMYASEGANNVLQHHNFNMSEAEFDYFNKVMKAAK